MVACHYEIKVGSYVFCDDLLHHAQEDKENLKGESETRNILTRAVYEVFGVSVKKTRKRSRSEGGTLKNVFSNLIKKTNCTEMVDKDGSLQQKWEKKEKKIGCSSLLEREGERFRYALF